jgi:hypothetical protein
MTSEGEAGLRCPAGELTVRQRRIRSKPEPPPIEGQPCPSLARLMSDWMVIKRPSPWPLSPPHTTLRSSPSAPSAPDGGQSGGRPPTDRSRIPRRLYWLRLFRWPTLPRGHHHAAHGLRIFTPALDIGSHINARHELLPEAGAKRRLEAVSSMPVIGRLSCFQ